MFGVKLARAVVADDQCDFSLTCVFVVVSVPEDAPVRSLDEPKDPDVLEDAPDAPEVDDIGITTAGSGLRTLLLPTELVGIARGIRAPEPISTRQRMGTPGRVGRIEFP